jgi:4,5-DOPA dioxygenase extradiol
MDGSVAARMPVLFVGHGSPTSAIEDNRWSRGIRALAALAPKPRAILAVSAHWYVDGVFVTAGEHPRTIHDFGGFPDELYEVQYPARGDPGLAARVVVLLPGAAASSQWGLDHGTWSVLRLAYPAADVPVVQLAIDRRLSPARLHELARALRQLRDDGVLILGSGNVTHDLRDAFARQQRGDETVPEYARDFDAAVRDALASRDVARLLELHASPAAAARTRRSITGCRCSTRRRRATTGMRSRSRSRASRSVRCRCARCVLHPADAHRRCRWRAGW